MPELTPTLGYAAMYDGGVVIAANMKGELPVSAELVPCLILPAYRFIEQCPEEWKDGRDVWIWIKRTESSAWFRFFWSGDDWLDFDNESIDWYVSYGGTPTHIMLPPPAPQEAQDAR